MIYKKRMISNSFSGYLFKLNGFFILRFNENKKDFEYQWNLIAFFEIYCIDALLDIKIKMVGIWNSEMWGINILTMMLHPILMCKMILNSLMYGNTNLNIFFFKLCQVEYLNIWNKAWIRKFCYLCLVFFFFLFNLKK